MNSTSTNIFRTLPDRRAARLASRRLLWAIHLAALGALLALLTWVNVRAIENAVEVWWVSPTFSHCFLILPISAYLVFRRRHELARGAPSAYPIVLMVAPPLLVLSFAGRLADINEFEQFAYIAILQLEIVAVLGPAIYRQILFPCLFLFFLVPTGDYLIDPLQRFTTHFVSSGLSILGIPHITEGNIIKLSNGIFEVAEACAGLRFLIATLAIGVLFVWLTYRKWYKAALFLVACFALPVFANGFRALGIVLIAHWTDNRLAAGVDHIVYGWGFLVGVLLVLMVIGGRYADSTREKKQFFPIVETRFRPISLGAALILSVIAISSSPSVLHWDRGGQTRIDASAFSMPLKVQGWQQSVPSGGWAPDYKSADGQLAFAMHEPGSSAADVDVFVDYYAGRNGSRKLLSPDNTIALAAAWHAVSDGRRETAIGGDGLAVREDVISSAGLMRIVWSTYWTAGRFTTSARIVKLERLRDVFSRTNGAALLALSTPAEGNLVEARARLDRAFRALTGIPSRLQKTSGD